MLMHIFMKLLDVKKTAKLSLPISVFKVFCILKMLYQYNRVFRVEHRFVHSALPFLSELQQTMPLCQVADRVVLFSFFRTAPLVKIKQALTKLRQETIQMDIQIGVMEHTLLQSKVKEKSNMTRDMHATVIPEATVGVY